ncbi:hypothetical protein BOTBODRAFT_171595 [Botryobasidium botryosum FD-172 SS1]|uniref:CFEM domain-containing protein n=1 Tax=Botryobasidium botryosum (strain FD-172 SS1) TaxID=930990 RepID=A0A067N2B8_BOTB1|nr:hypothetical protein BOTBODRAFT_171595 [Botryobasidium botryosum FD-172 SS1]
MMFSVVALLLSSLALVSAQTAATPTAFPSTCTSFPPKPTGLNPPICTFNCANAASLLAGCCGPYDTKCVCNSPTFINDAGSCIDANCSAAEQNGDVALLDQLCAGVAITISGFPTASATKS